MARTAKRKALNGASAQNGHASYGHKSLILWALQLAPAFIDHQVVRFASF